MPFVGATPVVAGLPVGAKFGTGVRVDPGSVFQVVFDGFDAVFAAKPVGFGFDRVGIMPLVYCGRCCHEKNVPELLDWLQRYHAEQ